MRKNIKYSASFFIIILSLMLGYVTYAEDSTTKEPVACTMEVKLCPDGVTSVGRIGPKCEFQTCPGEAKRDGIKNKFEDLKKQRELNKEENKVKRDQFKQEIKDEKEGLRIEHQKVIEDLIQTTRTKREELKSNFETKKEEVKLKVAEMKTRFKEDLGKIKDENKRLSAEKILQIIQDLNIKHTDNLSAQTDKIENVLVSIESRTTKAESNGLDVTIVKAEIEKSKIAITTAREAISTQVSKVYEVNVTDETKLRAEMKKLRDLFQADIKVVREKVKLAHVAVKNAAVTLAQIPRVNETEIKADDSSNKVDDTQADTNVNN